MENNRIYPPRRVMVSKPFIIEKSSIFFREEISGENSGESEMVALVHKKTKEQHTYQIAEKILAKTAAGTVSLRQDYRDR